MFLDIHQFGGVFPPSLFCQVIDSWPHEWTFDEKQCTIVETSMMASSKWKDLGHSAFHEAGSRYQSSDVWRYWVLYTAMLQVPTSKIVIFTTTGGTALYHIMYLYTLYQTRNDKVTLIRPDTSDFAIPKSDQPQILVPPSPIQFHWFPTAQKVWVLQHGNSWHDSDF